MNQTDESEMMRGGRLVLCSYGLTIHQLTLETLAALRGCDIVYCQSLSDDSKRALERTCPPIEALNDRGMDDVVELLISQVRRGRKVAYLTYGDPMILNHCCERLAARCEREGLEYRIYPGISYLSKLFCALRLATMSAAGVYVSWTGSEGDGFNVNVPALVFLFGTKSNEGESVDRLIGQLQRVYPEEHEVDVLSCVHPDPGGLRRKTYRVGELRRAWDESDSQSTLYIPAVARPRVES